MTQVLETKVKCPTCKGTSEKGACSHCRKRLQKILKELISFLDFLNANPALRQQVTSKQEGRGSLSSSLIINVQIVDLISKHGVPLILESWAKMIIEDRNLSPSLLNPTKERSKLGAVHHILETHNDWLADTDLWRDYYQELREPWTTLHRIIFGERKPVKKIPCPVQDCKGSLHLETNADVLCIADQSHYWTYDSWSTLAKLIVS